jgi:hypothetical protein
MSHARHVNVARMPGVGDWWTPPDDPPWIDCELCDGKGSRMVLDEGFKPYRSVCEACEGCGKLDAETGQPYDRDALQRLCEGD